MFSFFNWFSSNSLPDDIQATYDVFESYLKKSITDLSLLNTLANQLRNNASIELFGSFFNSINDLYNEIFKEFRRTSSHKEYFVCVNLSLMIYKLSLMMEDTKEYYESFFQKNNYIWNTLCYIFTEMSRLIKSTDLIDIYYHLLFDKKIIDTMKKFEFEDNLFYYQTRIKDLNLPINRIDLDEEEYKEIVTQVDSLSFDNENFYSDTSLEVQEKFVYKALLIQSILRILSSDKANNLLSENKNIMTTFIDKVINKSQEFYLNKLGKNYHCLFRREQIYDDLLKYSLFIFGNDYYYTHFFPFVKALLAIDIKESTSLDISAEFFKFFLSIRNIPKIIIIIMKILQKQSVEHFEMESDNFYVCFVYLFFNFLCSPKINEIYNIGISSNVKISLVNKMIMNVCYKQKFSESEKEILFFNDFIDTLNFQLKKNIKETIERIQWEDIDRTIEEELQRYGLKESNLFINAYDCYLVKKLFGNKEQYQFI